MAATTSNSTVTRTTDPRSGPAHSAPWSARLRQVGWVLLPLRAFLGVTMIYAGLLKFFDPAYLDPNSPNGVQQQMTAAATTSPIAFMVTFTAQHSALFGLSIAFGELAVGLGVLLGLFTRVAAVGGFLLSLSFFLTVSWGTTPYFFGPDIVFMFAFTPLMLGGDGGVLSLQSAIAVITRRRMGLAVPKPALESRTVTAEVDRRVVLRTAGAAVAVGIGALVVGGIGRLSAGASTTSDTGAAAPDTLPSGPATSPTIGPAPLGEAAPASAAPAVAAKPAGGVRIAQAANVPVGGVKAFTDPATNQPAYLLQPRKGTFLAYSAVCTHQGCTVGFDKGSKQFACPCHGARFDAGTGDVLRGPARKPLAKINVVESGGIVYAV
jgi:thiosulfate dehydrogenase (quinone) large subunit